MKLRQLIRQQKQAYEGAKMFYMCFLPLVGAIICMLDLIYEGITSISHILIAIISYIVALKYYKLCNTLDTSILKYQIISNNTNISDISMVEVIKYEEQYTPDSPEKTINNNDEFNDKQSEQMKEKNIEVPHLQDQTKPLKIYCKKCQILCPYRTRHCYKCQICIQRYDHHCFWIGSCVGYNNHRQFYLFLLFQTINNVSLLYTQRCLHPKVADLGIVANIMLYTCQLASLGFLFFTSYLLLYHTMLMLAGLTTWEHMARSKITYLNYLPSGYNPFSKGIMKNIKEFWYHNQQDYSKRFIQYDIPTFQQAKNIKPQCNLIENQYYSCC